MKNLLKYCLLAVVLCSVVAIPDWTNLESMVEQAIEAGVFPGIAIAIGSSKNVYYNKVWGTYQYRRDIFMNNVTIDTRWDLDRLSPALSLVPTYMHLLDNGRLNLSDHVSKYEFDFDNNLKKNLSLENMMLHNSGFEAYYPLPLPKTGDEIIRHINAAKLNYTTATKALYSDEGLIVLGEVVQKVTGKPLEAYVYQVNVELGLRLSNFPPVFSAELFRIAPTAVVAGKGLLHGKAFEPMSYLLNSTAGHAGIFSSASDVLRFFRILLSGGQLAGEARLINKATVDLFTTKPTNLKYNNSRAYVFDTVPNDDPTPPCGTKFTPEKNFGLYGQTGALAWADKVNDVAIVILTNALYTNGTSKVKDLMPKLSDEIMTQLGY